MQPFKRIGCIVNPIAGGGSSPSKKVKRCLQLLQRKFPTCFIEYTDHRGAEYQAVSRLSTHNPDCIVVFGGDGSLHHVLNACMQLAPDKIPTFAIYPSGSGNDFARMLKTPSEPEHFIEMLLSQMPKKVDIGEITFSQSGEKHWFINCVGMGLDVEVVRQVNAI